MGNILDRLLRVFACAAIVFSVSGRAATYCWDEAIVKDIAQSNDLAGVNFEVGSMGEGSREVTTTEGALGCTCDPGVAEFEMTEGNKTDWANDPLYPGRLSSDLWTQHANDKWYFRIDREFTDLGDGMCSCVRTAIIRYDGTSYEASGRMFPKLPGDQAAFTAEAPLETWRRKVTALGRVWVNSNLTAAPAQNTSGSQGSPDSQWNEYRVAVAEVETCEGGPCHWVLVYYLTLTGRTRTRVLNLCGEDGNSTTGDSTRPSTLTVEQQKDIVGEKETSFRGLLDAAQQGAGGVVPEHGTGDAMLYRIPVEQISGGSMADVDAGQALKGEGFTNFATWASYILKFLTLCWVFREGRAAIVAMATEVTKTTQLSGSTVPLVSEGIAWGFAIVITAAIGTAVALAWGYLGDYVIDPAGFFGVILPEGGVPRTLVASFLKVVPLDYMIPAIIALYALQKSTDAGRVALPMAVKFLVT